MKTRIPPLLALAGALCGCPQENHAGPEFFAICSNPEPTPGCLYPAACEQIALFNYAYDPTVAPDLLVPIEMNNPLLDNSDPSSGRVNTNDAVIQQWRLEYLAGGISVATAAYDQTQVVPAASHTVALVPVIPVSLNLWAQGLPSGAELVVNVRAAGRYLDERYFETGPFRVPVSIGTYSAPLNCTPPDELRACPQVGQTGSYACVTP